MRPQEIPGAHGDDAALLEGSQGVQGTGQLLRGRGHPDAFPLALGAAWIIAFTGGTRSAAAPARRDQASACLDASGTAARSRRSFRLRRTSRFG